MNIVNLLEQIERGEVVLPAIQRDFVWSREKIEKLMDSIMRGYPIGIVFLWETYGDIEYRRFVKDYSFGDQLVFYDNGRHNRLKLVLDGQQRLQSLYIALYGTYEGRHLYFDVLSGGDTDDFNEDKFSFAFFTPEESDKKNRNSASVSEKGGGGKNDEVQRAVFYLTVKDIVSMGAFEKRKVQGDIARRLGLSSEDELRMGFNLSALNDALFFDRNILKATVIDEYKPQGSRDRKSESDVLEAFVRINRQGTPLGKSDLFFSMLRLNWRESAGTLDEFVDSVNEGNSFHLDSDFVIRCLLAVSGLGTKLNVNLLRSHANVTKIKNNFTGCCNAIRSAVEFVENHCRIRSSKLLKGYNNLIPFIHCFFHIPDQQAPEGEINRLRKAVYLFGLSSLFSKNADSRLGKFIEEVLRPAARKNSAKFPLEESLHCIRDWEKPERYGNELIRGNPPLALHLIRHRSNGNLQYNDGFPKIDSIFPSRELRKLEYEDADVNHFANLWILPENKSPNKGGKNLSEYFRNVSDAELKRALIDRNLLDYGSYKDFLKEREAKILAAVKKELRLSDSDFGASAHRKSD